MPPRSMTILSASRGNLSRRSFREPVIVVRDEYLYIGTLGVNVRICRWATSSGADEPGDEDQGNGCSGSAVRRIGGAFLDRQLYGLIRRRSLRLARSCPSVQQAGQEGTANAEEYPCRH